MLFVVYFFFPCIPSFSLNPASLLPLLKPHLLSASLGSSCLDNIPRELLPLTRDSLSSLLDFCLIQGLFFLVDNFPMSESLSLTGIPLKQRVESLGGVVSEFLMGQVKLLDSQH